MRARVAVRTGLALGALATAVPFAVDTPRADAQAQADAAVSARVKDRSVRYGRALVVTGRVASGQPGVALTLEFRPRGGAWAVVARGQSGTAGAYRLKARVRRSGEVRVVAGQDGAVVRAAEAASAPALVGRRARDGRRRAADDAEPPARDGRPPHARARCRSAGRGSGRRSRFSCAPDAGGRPSRARAPAVAEPSASATAPRA